MKRLICFILTALLLFSLFGCAQKHDSIEIPAQFYYRNATVSYNSEQAVLRAEVREVAGCELTDIITLYLQGPETDDCISPFPTGVTVQTAELDGSRLRIMLNTPFDSLTGIELTLGCACLSKTMMELTQCTSVEISVPDATLNGSTSVIMDEQSLLLLDSSYSGTS